MKYLPVLMAGLMLFASCSNKNAQSEEPTKSESEKVIIAYVTSWSSVMPDTKYLTHINYAFGHVNDTFDGVRIDNAERLRQIVALRDSNPKLKVLVSVGGWGSGRFSEMAADENLRKSFAADCQRIVKEFALDGIDIDWEYPTEDMAGISASPEDTDNYTLLMRDIRQAIGTNKLLTQVTVANGKYMDHKALDQYLDFTNIMAYDMGMPPLHHSGLYASDKTKLSSDEAVKLHLAGGVPKHKLVMGMPFYGKAHSGFKRPRDLTKAHEIEGYTSHWDDVAKVPYLVDDKTGEMIFCYENLESLALKCKYINEQELLGAMYWSYDGDNEAGDLLRIVYQTLMKTK